MNVKLFLNIADKLKKSPSSLLKCSIILWTDADDAMKPLKCSSMSFYSVEELKLDNNVNDIIGQLYCMTIGSWLACICQVMDALGN